MSNFAGLMLTFNACAGMAWPSQNTLRIKKRKWLMQAENSVECKKNFGTLSKNAEI
jgi:hypothetical protein